MSDICIVNVGMNVEKLDLAALKALDALLAERSVTRAADRLGLSQPAMSAQLRRLREAFGDPILTRVPGGSAPTPRALALQQPVSDILTRVRGLAEASGERFTPRGLRARLCVAATDYVAHLVLGRIVRELQAQAPDLHLDVRMADRTRVRERMEQGDVDLGIGSTTVPTGRLRFRTLYRDSAVCIGSRAQHGMREPFALARFGELAHLSIAPAKPSFYDEALDRALERRGASRRIVLTVQDFLVVPDVVRTTSLVAVVPARLLEGMELRDLMVAPPPVDLPEMPVGMYWHERTDRSPLHRWFRRTVQESLRELRRA
jgi:DNA-binding transcriptional LysR family regulator